MGSMRGYRSFKPESMIAKSLVVFLLLGAVGLVGFIVFFYYAPVYPAIKWAPVQPVAFSHKLHAGDNKINCQYCHSYARRSEMAGIPSVKKCMNCHQRMLKKVNTPKIQEVVSYFKKGEPIPWVRIYDLPDHVWFSHKRHIARDVPCQKCHGPVETMEVVERQRIFQMGYCLDCHQENQANTDCLTCHT